ncbi:hypothetical protein Y032_0391g570 [Ancylostoma ceylanicum]|uniref:Transposase n=1 Tax=Ancylostoma ceylanicum TaxID=53326 RepID=A0A016RRX7_9BILA|nr:hypothetical protein Y032_0391g570 [Ancylostoma ceylanicum]
MTEELTSAWRTTAKKPNGELHEKKVLLCCWWESEGMLYWELMPSGHTVSAEVYSNQLQKLADANRLKRKKIDHVVLLVTTPDPTWQSSLATKLPNLDGRSCHALRILQTWLHRTITCFEP